jgi:hypothetical protein
MSKQTAVEWFYDTMKNKKIGDGQILIDIDTLLNDFNEAKQMEKEQIVDGWLNGMKGEMIAPLSIDNYKPEAEEYFNETYGGQYVEVYSKNNVEKKYNCDYCHDKGRKYIGVPLGHLSCPQCKKY